MRLPAVLSHIVGRVIARVLQKTWTVRKNKGDEMRRCPSCHRENADDHAFCGACGAALEGMNREAARPQGAAFCTKCGRPLQSWAQKTASSLRALSPPRWPVLLGSFGGMLALLGVSLPFVYAVIGINYPRISLFRGLIVVISSVLGSAALWLEAYIAGIFLAIVIAAMAGFDLYSAVSETQKQALSYVQVAPGGIIIILGAILLLAGNIWAFSRREN